MITSLHSYGGVTATVYVMNAGEKIPRHQHTFAHTTSVAAGETMITVWDDGPRNIKQMKVGDREFELLALVDHEISALVDGTVVVNMAQGVASNFLHEKGNPEAAGGVLLEDGTVVNADTP